MIPTQTNNPTAPKSLRLWPGVVLVALQWLLQLVLPRVAPDAAMFGVMGSLLCGVLILVWWLFFSRAPWLERIGAVLLMVVAVFVTRPLVHPSIANGAMGMLPVVLSIPLLSLALVAWAAATRRVARRALRHATLAGALAVACGALMLIRTGGMSGSGGSDFHWRWTETPEQRLLARTPKPTRDRIDEAAVPPPIPTPRGPAEWPGFRGPQRDGVVRGTRITTDWSVSPPKELWRRPVGPGWSSFAVHGPLFYTQEQRGEEELVSCYTLTTGALVWSHADNARFWESNGGAGPRGTPTLHDGRVYACGATGILNALDAATGQLIWTRNAATDTGRKLPGWGFSSSPLVVGDLVIAATGGVLAAYELSSGKPRWIGAKGGYGYSSPHLVTLEGVPQIVLLNGVGAMGVAPVDGQVLWKHEWKSDGIVQPVVLEGGDLLIGSGSGLGVKVGVQRVAFKRSPDGWTTEERWTSNRLKPYFNDFVVHQGHAYGFDGTTIACIALADGERKWKGGRYGNGQLVLLADQDLLLVLSEQGDVALANATPDQFVELARLPALEGKTWNHPVLAGDILLVRNAEEMAGFRLPTKGGG